MAFCTIHFENNAERVFYSGQRIRGSVQLVLSKRTKVRSVYIKFKGDAHTEWYEYVKKQVGFGDHRRTVYERVDYRSDEVHLRFRQYFASSYNVYLEVGEHFFNFEFQLPLELPSSFYSEYGNVSYSAIVVLVIPWGFDIKFEEQITIIKTVDLNQNPVYRNPTFDFKYINFYPCGIFCCFPSEPLRILASTPVGGYVPGQIINLSLVVDNKSNRRIPIFMIKLVKRITYYAGIDSKTETFYQGAAISSRGVEMNQKRIFRMSLQVPSNWPSDVTSSGIIKISYYILVSAEMNRLFKDPKLKVHVTIGTVPIHDFAELNELDQATTFSHLFDDPQPSTQSEIQPSTPPKMSEEKKS